MPFDAEQARRELRDATAKWLYLQHIGGLQLDQEWQDKYWVQTRSKAKWYAKADALLHAIAPLVGIVDREAAHPGCYVTQVIDYDKRTSEPFSQEDINRQCPCIVAGWHRTYSVEGDK